MRILFLLSLLISCSTNSKVYFMEEVTFIDTVIIDIPHRNLGMFCFPSRTDTLIESNKIYLKRF